MTVQEAGFGKDKFVAVTPDYTVIDAITYMIEERASCVAVVDEGGVLMGQFSARDVRGIGPSTFYRLREPILSFLQSASPDALEPITVGLDSLVGEVSQIMADSDRHHLWIVNDNCQPKQCISLCDIMRLSRTGEEIGVDTPVTIMTPRSQWSVIPSPRPAPLGFDAPASDIKNLPFDDIEERASEDENAEVDDPEDAMNQELFAQAYQEAVQEHRAKNVSWKDMEGFQEDDGLNYSDSDDATDEEIEELEDGEVTTKDVTIMSPREIQEVIWSPVETEETPEEEAEIQLEIEEIAHQIVQDKADAEYEYALEQMRLEEMAEIEAFEEEEEISTEGKETEGQLGSECV